jgi:hypothetical protein
MTITIKKIGSYALLGTLISANATSPAQATSLQNVTPDDSLTKTEYDNLAEIHYSDKTDSCVSIPELDLCHEFFADDESQSLNNSLLQKAKSSIELIRASEAIKVKSSENKVYHIYDIDSTASSIPVAGEKQLLYSNIYTKEQLELKIKKKVPEPSALLGLIAFCLLAAKHQAAKK